MNKRSRLLILLSSILVMSMTFLGCKDDERLDVKPVDSKTIHVELTANVVTSVPVAGNSTKGFNLQVNHSGAGVMTTPINWNSDTWNNTDNKPIVLAIVRSKSNKTAISNVRKLADTEYEYEPGHGSSSARIYISANFTEEAANNEILFYLLDKKDFDSRFHSSEKTLDFKGGASLYNISNPASPVWMKDIEDNVFVEPNDRIYFNFIFSGAIDLSNYNGGTSVNKEFDMRPLGTLLMTDFSPRTNGNELNNPAYVDGFLPTLSTNAFDISTKVNLVTASNTNTSTNIENQEVEFASYEATGTSTTPKTSGTEKIGGTSNKLSGVYVKYVLGRSHNGFSISLSNNKVTVFKHNNSATNFANEYASSRVPLNFLMTVEAVKPTSNPTGIIENNPLVYVAEHNVNKAKNGFAKKNTNEDAALVTWEEAKGLFGKNDYLKGYHLPNRYELQSIVPFSSFNVYFSSTNNGDITQNYSKIGDDDYNVEIGKAMLKDIKSYYQTVYEFGDGNVTYAIRFAEGTLVKDNNGQTVNKTLSVGNNPYISVWRYSYVDNPHGGGGKIMAVYCKVLPANTTIQSSGTLMINTGSGMVDFKERSFFVEKNGTLKEDVVYREFPASGYGDSPRDVGSNADYWSSSPFDYESTTGNRGICCMGFSDRNTKMSLIIGTSGVYAVRPFSKKSITSRSVVMVKPAYAGLMVNNPLVYVPGAPINKAKTGFNRDGNNEDIGLFTFDEAKELFNNKSNVFLRYYHLATSYEWKSIIPGPSYNTEDYVYFAPSERIRVEDGIRVEIYNVVLENMKSYYQTMLEDGHYVTYAIRFAEGTLVKDIKGQTVNKTLSVGDNPYISVWRYSYIDNPRGGKMLAVYSRSLPANAIIQTSGTLKIDIDPGSGMVDFKNKSFFAESNGTPKPYIVYRTFLASGNNSYNVGFNGFYWSDTELVSSNQALYMLFGSNSASVLTNGRHNKYAVCPFLGKKK